jgi:hypothetical protein
MSNRFLLLCCVATLPSLVGCLSLGGRIDLPESNETRVRLDRLEARVRSLEAAIHPSAAFDESR